MGPNPKPKPVKPPRLEPEPPRPPDLPPAEELARQERVRAAREVMGKVTSVTAFHADEFRKVAMEAAQRSAESIRLYEPLAEQQRFHRSKARVRLLRGSNRGGKTLPAAVEVARAVLGCDPYCKYPKTDGTWFAVGKDQKHIGQVMYPKLFRSRAFKVIRDQETGKWRAFRPWVPEDVAREAEAKPAPPLIPPRFIAEIGWENKKENVPNVVRLINGWELMFFPSGGKPPQGSAVDGWWFDEEITDPDWYPEMTARILDRMGSGIWSATPQAGTEQLYELHEKAERERGEEDATVEEFEILLADNPHISAKAKREFAASLTEEERRVRVEGEFAVSSFKVYPEFSMHVHGVPYFDVPAGWTRYMAVDPGHQICAVLFAAVPPPDEGDFIYLYDELYIKDCNAAMFASGVKQKVGPDQLEAAVIDAHMGIHTELGIGKTVAQQYTEALREAKVSSRLTGSGFIFGSDDVLAGLGAVHSLLRIRPDGTTKLRVLEGKCPNLEWELKRYHKKRVGGIITEMPNQRKNNHACDSLRYLSMLNPKYVARRPEKRQPQGAFKAWKQKQDKRRQMSGHAFVRLGPGK